MKNAAPMRLAFALIAIGMFVAAATVIWAVLQPGTVGGRQSVATARVPAGSSLPMLQDIDPERLDGARGSPSVAPRASTPPPARRIGDSVLYADGWKLTLLTFAEQPPTQFQKPQSGTRLVLVTLRFENTGTAGARAYSTEFKLQDGAAVRSMYSPCLYECRADQLDTLDLGPGGSQSRWLIFPAPIGDARLALVYQRLGYREVVWNLF